MRLNRRNVLVGLGTIVAGGGAALGTGAFSTATATREVTITTNSDSDALIGLSPGASSWVEENDDGVLSITANDLNSGATFTIDSAFTVVNNHDESVGIELDDDSGAGEPSFTYSNSSFTLGTTEEDDAEEIDLTVDTEEVETGGSFNVNITVTATPNPNND